MGSYPTELNGSGSGLPQIIDIRSDTAYISLKQGILDGLHPADGGEKTLPTLLLYDDKGLRLFEQITYLEQYYLTETEIEILQAHADRIAAEYIPDGAQIVELGSGNLRKIKILLDALERRKKKANYYALDLMHDELVRTLALVPDGTFNYVTCAGLWGTYDDGLEWLKRPENANKPKAILSMGSSIGNFTPEEAKDFISQFASELGPEDVMLIALDGCQDPDKVYHAYNDKDDVTHNFTSNGLKHANRLLGYEAFNPEIWEAVGQYDQKGSRHQAFVAPNTDVTVEDAHIKKGEKVRIEESHKWPFQRAEKLWYEAGANNDVIEGAFFGNSLRTYFLHLLSRSKMIASSKPEQYAAHPVPSLDEWHQLWSFWDLVTRQMIPESELFDKPIKLRNACIFYLGHIPTFFDMKITEATNGKPTEPKYFYKIFERGIDPDVDNPEKVHAHSEVPDTWPDLNEILAFQNRVRERVINLYNSGHAYNHNWTARAIWLGFEHEVMHLETLLYMLVQSDKTLPPRTTMKPNWEQFAAQSDRDAVENQWFDIPEQQVQIGLNDPENATGPVRYFGWDVEKPAYKAKVKAFKAKARPITNGEYAKYMAATGKEHLPASWTILHTTNGVNGANGYANGVNGVNGYENGHDALYHFVQDKAIRTVHGLVPLKFALHWPVAASFDELSGCARYMGGRIPTLEEARSIYYYADSLKKKEVSKALGRTIPAVNGHLVNNGVEETPPSKHMSNGLSSAAAGPDPNPLFANLEDANVGFKRWHPVPVTQNGSKLAGLGEIGGLWEWTSSALEKINGYEPMKMYPAYSADFYDDKHNIVLGGSWATHPRIAGRKTFVNWYQRNYPFVWAGARLVKDA